MTGRVEQDWRLSHEWVPPVREAARKLFPNQGLHGNAEFIAALHPRAIDYLTQAPVLACAMGAVKSTSADKRYIGSRLGGPIERGERLRSVMAAVGLPQPMRQITPFALSPGTRETIFELAKIPPSSLALIIPLEPGKQRKWLSNLKAWRQVFKYRGIAVDGFQWAARAMSIAGPHSGEVQTVADYLISNKAALNDRWSWDRAMTEAELWHDRLASEKSLLKIGGGIGPETRIDYSDLPDEAKVHSFTFVKLFTPAALFHEGRRMRHCVASYLPDVIGGRCTIYSIRHGERRLATLEISETRCRQLKGFANAAPPKGIAQAVQTFLASPTGGKGGAG